LNEDGQSVNNIETGQWNDEMMCNMQTEENQLWVDGNLAELQASPAEERVSGPVTVNFLKGSVQQSLHS